MRAERARDSPSRSSASARDSRKRTCCSRDLPGSARTLEASELGAAASRRGRPVHRCAATLSPAPAALRAPRSSDLARASRAARLRRSARGFGMAAYSYLRQRARGAPTGPPPRRFRRSRLLALTASCEVLAATPRGRASLAAQARRARRRPTAGAIGAEVRSAASAPSVGRRRRVCGAAPPPRRLGVQRAAARARCRIRPEASAWSTSRAASPSARRATRIAAGRAILARVRRSSAILASTLATRRRRRRRRRCRSTAAAAGTRPSWRAPNCATHSSLRSCLERDRAPRVTSISDAELLARHPERPAAFGSSLAPRRRCLRLPRNARVAGAARRLVAQRVSSERSPRSTPRTRALLAACSSRGPLRAPCARRRAANRQRGRARRTAIAAPLASSPRR